MGSRGAAADAPAARRRGHDRRSRPAPALRQRASMSRAPRHGRRRRRRSSPTSRRPSTARRGRRGRRPRLRRPVLAADRAARARVRGLLASCCPTTSASRRSRRRKPKGLILSGGPASVYADGAPKLDPELLELGIPVLGICYGMQLLALELGGRVEGAEVGEFGRSRADGARAGPAAGRAARRADLLDVAPRHGLRGAARASPRSRRRRRRRSRRSSRRRARHLRDPVPPRGRPHALRPATSSRRFLERHLRLRPDAGRAASIVEEQIARIRAQVGDGKVICGLVGRRRLLASPRCSCTARSATSSRACSSTTA